MSRQALLAAALAAALPAAARAEPLDIDLSRIGPPDPQVWTSVAGASPEYAQWVAGDARRRFAMLSSEMALALSSAVLHPASTTGYSGFAFDLEVAAVPIHPGAVGVTAAGYSDRVWPTASAAPSTLFLPSVHVRKALPFSLELGGRLVYLASSNVFAAQGEAKWAIHEGFEYFPDVAVRAAYTRLFGVEDWNLSATDLDLMISKRWAIMGVTSLTPYLVARATYVSASSDRIEYAAAPSTGAAALETQAAFPHFGAWYYRPTLGLRFTAYAVALALEGTYLFGRTVTTGSYRNVKIASSLGGAAKLGWEW